MGVILDSSVLIAAKRQGNNARQMLAAVSSRLGNTEVALSVLTLLELILKLLYRRKMIYSPSISNNGMQDCSGRSRSAASTAIPSSPLYKLSLRNASCS